MIVGTLTPALTPGIEVVLLATGLLAGAVDAIAGGGALIALPVIMVILGSNATAIGTNKVGGLTAAVVALIVYARRGHADWRQGIVFTLLVSLAAIAGAYVAPFIPPAIFPWILAITCPIILYVVWQKDGWTTHAVAKPTGLDAVSSTAITTTHSAVATDGITPAPRWIPLILAALACGFYDGVWGPGGGTFMFFALLIFARLPLFTSLALAKLANSASALLGLSVYTYTGHVRFDAGLFFGLGMLGGAYTGARMAHARSTAIIRPVLTGVVILLMGTVIYKSMHHG